MVNKIGGKALGRFCGVYRVRRRFVS